MHEAKTTLSKLVERAQNGEEIVLTKNGTPVARLEPVRRKNRMSQAHGVLKGQVWMPDDFDSLDDLGDEFKEAFGIE
jgi:prevent-host-death family protein